jgi:hypothetical protein
MVELLARRPAGRYEQGRPGRRLAIAITLGALALGAPPLDPGAGEALAADIAPTSNVVETSPEPIPTPLTPPYPDANDPTALGRWFGQTTHLPAKSILAITENAIFAAFPQHTSGPLWTVDVRIEAITPQSTAKLGGRSIRLRLNVRCDTNTVRLSFLDVYPGADLTGAPTHRAPPNDWARPKPNSYVADAVRLACDKTFQGPFAAIASGGPEPAPAPKQAPALRARPPLKSAYAAQIGAYSTAALSEGAWQALKAAKPELSGGLTSVTTPVKVGARTLYRAIVKGFPSAEAAASFCQTLRTSGRPCLVVGAGAP